MRKAVLMLAVMVLAGCGNVDWFPSEDTEAPKVTSFTYHAEEGNPTVFIDSLTASDDEGVTGYRITETATTPSASDAGWSPSPPATYTFAGTAITTLYAWARDAVGHVSAAVGADPVYTLQTPIPFPAIPGTTKRVQSVSDLAYDSSNQSYWLLASLTSGTIPSALVRIDGAGQVLLTVDLAYSPLSYIGEESSMAYDGSSFWVSSSGYDTSVVPAVPKSEVYKIVRSGQVGQYQGFFPCPATATGFCQGLAWDGATLWASGSDNRHLVNFQNQATGGVLPLVRRFDNIWSTNGVSDTGYDRTKGELLALKDGLIMVNGADGALLGSKPFTLPGTGRGDWDGTYFWVVDKVNSRLLRLKF